MTELTLALDWTPNINHIGFFVAREKRIFQSHGLNVQLLDPAADNYQITPAKKVERGEADLALCPMESVISYRTKAEPFPLKAIAALLQEDLSAIAVGPDSDIRSPKDLDGKTYASYHARYEDAIVQQMIRNDGGRGDLRISYPDKLGIWDTILQGRADATWIFLNWEGVEAESRGVELNAFNLKDYGIPYSYSPVLAADENKLEAQGEALTRFLAASKQGFLFARAEPAEGAGLLAPFLPASDRHIDLDRSLAYSAPYFGDADKWGRMDPERVQVFLNWLKQHELESHPLQAAELVTNSLLP